jgi:hypothetical protein
VAVEDETQLVAPADVAEGDVIGDEPRKRWLTVTEIQNLSGPDGGVYVFYGDDPEHRITFGADERVPRRKHKV